MPEEQWNQVYVNRCESGFYDQGAPELTIPVGMKVWWRHDSTDESKLNQPEMDVKDSTVHPEVYEGRFSFNGFFLYSTGVFFLVTDPIYVQRGQTYRASMMYMHKFSGGQCGGRLGVVDGNGPFAAAAGAIPVDAPDPSQNASITWGPWLSTYGGQPYGKWDKMSTPNVIPAQGSVRIAFQFNSDYPSFAGAHGDVITLEQAATGEPDPVPGDGVDYDRIEQIVRSVLSGVRITA